MDGGNALGEFLRIRRDRLAPGEVGLPAGEPRRVPGLRRGEVAALAGLSTDYYMRLEQGRERHPSDQVVTALARAMRLEPAALNYLRRLAQPPPTPAPVAETLPTATLLMLQRLADVPACVVGVALDVLALNALGRALYSGFERTSNLVEMVFLDPAARTFYQDWPDIATGCVRSLRASAGEHPHSVRVRELVAEVSAASEEFAARWVEHRLVARTTEKKRYVHPEVGDLELQFEAYSVASSPGQHLYVYLAETGSASDQRLALLR